MSDRRGRQTRALTKDQIELLDRFRKSPQEGFPAGYSLPQLVKAMAAPFTYKTLGKALQGLPVWDLHHSWLAGWIERYLVERPAASDDQEPDG